MDFLYVLYNKMSLFVYKSKHIERITIMFRNIQTRDIPLHYQQPTVAKPDWTLEEFRENVDYIPQKHVRIWYNNEKGSYDLHYHDAIEIILCVENQTIIKTTDKTYILNVGDILFIPSQELHELIFEDWGIRFIFLLDTKFLTYYDDFKLLDLIFIKPRLFTSDTEIYHEIYNNLMQMVDIYFENLPFWELDIHAKFMMLISQIGKYYQNCKLSDDKIPKKQKYNNMQTILNYIDSNYTSDISLEETASKLGFSKFYFAHLFKKHTNITFYNYLIHKRIQKAQSLLKYDDSITDIAMQSGFNNLTTFCRAFKKITNYTPSEYRNKFYNHNI